MNDIDPAPLCFTSRQQFRLWSVAEQRSRVGSNGFCTDCLPEYQREMIIQRRCAYPGTTFDTDDDGFIEGLRPAEKGRNDQEVEAEVVAPA